MFKKNLIAFLIIGLALVFTTEAFSQNGKAKRSKRKVARKVTMQDGVLFPAYRRRNTKTSSDTQRKRLTKPVLNLEQPNGGMDTADEAPEFGNDLRRTNQRKGKIKRPGTQGYSIDGKGTDVNVEEYRVKSPRKRKTSARKKPKNTHNLLPYIEQSNIYRKRKRNK